MSGRVKIKHPCCQSGPRCKRCPVVLKRLEQAGLARRVGRRTYAVKSVGRRDFKVARAR